MTVTFTTTTTASKTLVVVGSTLALIGAASLLHSGARLYSTYSQSKKENDGGTHNENNDSSLSSIVDARRGSVKLKPPFPKAVRDMLSQCRLAYLSTVDSAVASSHLSLMRFTYLHDPEDGEVVIMSTNTKTKKFDMLQKQKGVSMLVHDFPPGGTDDVGLFSITLNGECRIVTEVTKEDQYRRAHLQHNPDYPQFIVGKDIAILCVDVTSARICNINDQVTRWDISDGIGNDSSS